MGEKTGAKDTSRPDSLAIALLARAQIEEDRYDFSAAARDYGSYLKLIFAPSGPDSAARAPASIGPFMDAKQLDTLRKKTLALLWLSGDEASLKASLAAKPICTENLAPDCEKYTVLSALTREPAPE
jgi:hypothetical protein